MKSKHKIALFSVMCILSLLAFVGDYPVKSPTFSFGEEREKSAIKVPCACPFTVGFNENPYTIDPLDCWDKYSMNVIIQCAEPLVGYNISDPDFAIIPVLAESWRWNGADEVSFKLREGVKFHDGTSFDADAVIWNLNRLTWFCNYSGTLPENATSWLSFPHSLYFFPDGVTPIIDTFFKNTPYNVTIRLTDAYAPFLNLLAFIAGHILSPSSTPRYRYLQMTEVVVGTGRNC
ncbi:MAG: ABC transporter substrate-binding protein [Candidatus Thorarchaeota archaeon]